MLTELVVRVGETEVNNPGTPSEFYSRELELVSNEQKVVARAETYGGFYSVYWIASLSPDQLVELAETTIAAYERNFPEGVKNVNGELSTINEPVATKDDFDEEEVMMAGVLYIGKDSQTDTSDRGELPYQRPLNMDQVRQAAPDQQFSLVRFNTMVADIALMLHPEGFNFGFITHLAEIGELVTLITESTEGAIPSEKAEEFLKAIVALYEH